MSEFSIFCSVYPYTSLPLILTSFTYVKLFSLAWLNSWKWIFMD